MIKSTKNVAPKYVLPSSFSYVLPLTNILLSTLFPVTLNNVLPSM
jgi:hypothetical protein